MENEFVPKVVTDLVDRLKGATGHDSRVDRIDARTWRLTTENDRVRLTVDFANKGNGKVRWRGSTLAVDGVPRERANGFDHFVRIFSDPDEAEETVVAEDAPPPEIMPMLPPGSVDEAPAVVRSAYEAMARVGKLPVEVGEADGRWMLGVETVSAPCGWCTRGCGSSGVSAASRWSWMGWIGPGMRVATSARRWSCCWGRVLRRRVSG